MNRLTPLGGALPSEILERAVAWLERPDGVLIAPTDTVYGLVCAWDHPAAIERIFALKQRPDSKPLALMSHDAACAAARLALDVSPAQWQALAAHLPGPITVLARSACREPLHPALFSPGPVLALRVPACPPLLQLARALGRPLASTSANLSGQPPAAAADEIVPQLLEGVDAVIDAGRAPAGVPSTIIDLTARPLHVVRPGALDGPPLQALLAALAT